MSGAAYLDSSALVKLVVTEHETASLRRWLRSHGERVTSALARVEVVRAVLDRGAAYVTRAEEVVGRCQLLSLDVATLRTAATVPPATLRSLDAIHLASARSLGSDLEVLVSYDLRLLEATASLGLATAAPGQRRP